MRRDDLIERLTRIVDAWGPSSVTDDDGEPSLNIVSPRSFVEFLIDELDRDGLKIERA